MKVDRVRHQPTENNTPDHGASVEKDDERLSISRSIMMVDKMIDESPEYEVQDPFDKKWRLSPTNVPYSFHAAKMRDGSPFVSVDMTTLAVSAPEEIQENTIERMGLKLAGLENSRLSRLLCYQNSPQSAYFHTPDVTIKEVEETITDAVTELLSRGLCPDCLVCSAGVHSSFVSKMHSFHPMPSQSCMVGELEIEDVEFVTVYATANLDDDFSSHMFLCADLPGVMPVRGKVRMWQSSEGNLFSSESGMAILNEESVIKVSFITVDM